MHSFQSQNTFVFDNRGFAAKERYGGRNEIRVCGSHWSRQRSRHHVRFYRDLYIIQAPVSETETCISAFSDSTSPFLLCLYLSSFFLSCASISRPISYPAWFSLPKAEWASKALVVSQSHLLIFLNTLTQKGWFRKRSNVSVSK